MKIDWKLEKTKPVFDRLKTADSVLLPHTRLGAMAVYFGLLLFSVLAMLLLEATATYAVRKITGTVNSLASTMIALLGTSAQIAAFTLYAKYYLHSSLQWMGFVKKRALLHYLIGIVCGIALFGGAVWVASLLGVLNYKSKGIITPQMFAWLTLGWFVQGLSEEVDTRGFLMILRGQFEKPWHAIIGSAVIFSLMHVGNDGITVYALFNLTLFGIMESLIFLRTGSIWGCAALHSFWNLAQGNLFGLPVSGIDAGRSVLWYTLDSGANEFLTGGGFGLEGSICVTAVLLLGILAAFLLPQTKLSKQTEETDS